MDSQTLASLPPHLLAQYLRDPQAMLAQETLNEGTDSSPLKGGIMEGVARLGKGALGGYMAGKLRDKYSEKAGNVANERQQAMALALGKPAQTEQTQDGTTINWNEQKPNYMAAAAGLSSPDNAALAGSLFGAQVNQDQQSRSFEQQKAMQEASLAQQRAMQNAGFAQQRAMQEEMLNRQIEFEKFKIANDPLKMVLSNALAAQGGMPQAAPQTPIPADGSIPKVNASELLPPQGQPQQTAQPAQQNLGLFNAALSASGLKAPEGMMFDQKMNLVPSQNVKLNDEQSKALGFANRMKEADAIIGSPKITGAATDWEQRAKGSVPLVGNAIVSPEYQQYDQASRNFINAVLRRESGAVISPLEFENADKQYFPQFGDDANTLAQKAANRKMAIDNILLAGGPKGQSMVQQPGNKVKVISPDGKTGTIDASELQQALASGWRQAQ